MTVEHSTAEKAVNDLARAMNTGGRQNDVADAIGSEHGYLVNQIVHGIALGVIRKCRSAVRSDPNEPVASCGQINYPLANGTDDTLEERIDHPYHDGELTCNAVRGALITLNSYHNREWRSSHCYIWK